ncbi:MAG: hypothetical protein QY323_02240 [Patescibacteria group bacterium]|nr:MAG: hypothetical protein QY323_02240 [Patescibacteria group bacterium]
MRAYFGGTAEGGVVVSLSKDGTLVTACKGGFTDDLLQLFDAALKKAKAKRSAITEIAVDKGPGGFSAVRRRVTVATALARALGARLAATGELSVEEAAQLPNDAFGAKTPVHPLYAAEPNITISKKKKTWNAH